MSILEKNFILYLVLHNLFIFLRLELKCSNMQSMRLERDYSYTYKKISKLTWQGYLQEKLKTIHPHIRGPAFKKKLRINWIELNKLNCKTKTIIV